MKVATQIPVFKQEVNDEQIIENIFQRCLEKDTCLPLLKEEIKLKIQCRRMKSGEHELKVEPRKQVKYLLTEEEILKKNRRKEQNRQSAKRTRARQKGRITELEKEIKSLEETNRILRQCINSQTSEVDRFDKLLQTHVCAKTRLPLTCRQLLSPLPRQEYIMIEEI